MFKELKNEVVFLCIYLRPKKLFYEIFNGCCDRINIG